eukprot:Opistho-2@15773
MSHPPYHHGMAHGWQGPPPTDPSRMLMNILNVGGQPMQMQHGYPMPMPSHEQSQNANDLARFFPHLPMGSQMPHPPHTPHPSFEGTSVPSDMGPALMSPSSLERSDNTF